MPTAHLSVSAIRQAKLTQVYNVTSGGLALINETGSIYAPSDNKLIIGHNNELQPPLICHYYYAGGIKFGNLKSSYFTSKYFSSLTINVNIAFTAPIVFRVQDVPITSTSHGRTAYQNFTSGTVIGTAPGDGKATSFAVTDSTLIRKILLNGIGLSWSKYLDYRTFTATNISVEYTYTDGAAPSVVSNLSPSGATILSTATNRFSWSFYQESGEPQTHYDLQYSTDEGTTWTTIANKVASSNKYHDVPAGTLPDGIIMWRVRTWTVSGTIASDWATAQVIVRTNPSSSSVSCDGKPRPTVTWSSSGQTAYQVRIGDHDSGAIFGTATSYKAPFYFADGVYPVTVRVQSSNGEWSDWTEPIYTQITNTGSGSISLIMSQQGASVHLSWTPSTACVAYLVYRNNIPIAQTTQQQFTDHYSNGLTQYKVLGILSSGYYISSEEITMPVQMPCDVISTINPVSWICLRVALDGPTSQSFDTTADVSYKKFAGREYPVPVAGGRKNTTLRATYAAKTREQAEAVEALVGKTVIIKNTHGGRMFGCVNRVGYDTGLVYEFDLDITRIDYVEEVAYVD